MRKMLLILLPLLLFAQNYVVQKDVLAAGGRKCTSTDYILQGTLCQTAIGNLEDTDYRAVLGFWHPPEPFPPDAPYIVQCEKSGSDMTMTWNMITTDTLGNSDVVHYYCVYRSTSPDFVPGASDSIVAIMQPDTTCTDAGVLDSTKSYYYLVKAVDVARNRSSKSNMGYKFNKFVNENAAATDKNWTSLPWHSPYSTVSDVTDDVSPSGDPLTKLTNLRDDQNYESWLWDDLFLEWFGTNFAITSGRGYEFITVSDDTVVFVGANNPDGLVALNENASLADKNWVSIPYNAYYANVSDITDEYCPNGDPLIKLTNLRDDQNYETWLWDDLFLEWFGADFAVTPGRGYEFITITDTTWNPTEHTNTAKRAPTVMCQHHSTVETQLGTDCDSDRLPVWHMVKSKEQSAKSQEPRTKNQERLTPCASRYTPLAVSSVERSALSVERNASGVGRNASGGEGRAVSHTVRAHFSIEEYSDFVFTAYRPDKPFDVLTEKVIGSGLARKGRLGALWFDAGNFETPWQDGEGVIVIVEALKDGTGHFTVLDLVLDGTVDIQELGTATLQPIPEPKTGQLSSTVSWRDIENPNIVGYSIYHSGTRLNDKVITEAAFAASEDVSLKPVIRGGFETIFGSQGPQSMPDGSLPISYSCVVQPNPFASRTSINYALPHAADVSIKIFDVSGRHVKTLVSTKCEPGYYSQYWSGKDDQSRRVAAGVYFLEMHTDEYEAHHKMVLVR